MQHGRINKSPSKKRKIERTTLEQLYLVALYFQNGISGGVSWFLEFRRSGKLEKISS
jgi:hypothetical protein